MESGVAAIFPRFACDVSDLYGANGPRVGEAQAYEHQLDDLDRAELDFDLRIQALVEKKAPVPVGVKFHREHATEEPIDRVEKISIGRREHVIAYDDEVFEEEEEMEEDDEEDEDDEDLSLLDDDDVPEEGQDDSFIQQDIDNPAHEDDTDESMEIDPAGDTW